MQTARAKYQHMLKYMLFSNSCILMSRRRNNSLHAGQFGKFFSAASDLGLHCCLCPTKKYTRVIWVEAQAYKIKSQSN